ncbi:Mitogen-activated protein kinase kinase kinase [Parasponia andersonii]|uniref:non-specific serine/threonine protein kinase n=1 Tax=Parasponia andersonii TaxID=3476 RepID=A0A2P5BPW4_PARAD|nr:Mitogen-activated protein kinase kinase kinase [Parasponia andersonii]
MAFKLSSLLVIVTQLIFLCSNAIVDKNQAYPEREALLSFKASLDNPHILSSWNVSTPHCNWVGVSCQQGRVNSLALPARSLKGPLSPSISSLAGLTMLDLSSNLFHGEIPPQIFSLKRLRLLALGDNRLDGDIPSQLGELTRLNFLDLGPNSFGGKIPPELGRLTQLETLDLSGNALTGSVPAQIGNLRKLLELDLSSNLLSGSPPLALFTNLQALSFLDVSNNSFAGTIPPEIGNLKNLTDLFIGMNHFSGQLPSQIGHLPRLENLNSHSCFITGPLPQELSMLQSLRNLDLSNNPLKCSIPKSFGKLQNLSFLILESSELNGSVPPELGKCRNLKTLLLSNNALSGSLPEELSELPMFTFSAEKNQLSGPLPSWLGKWNKVSTLLLGNNQFSAEIPPEIGNCSVLSGLSLSNNLLTGRIPEELCNASSLMQVDLLGNFLNGTIESTFVKCTSLTQLNLMENQIVGPIPEYLSELPLVILNLDYNNFTGTIPTSIWNSRTLMEFSATNNQLGGCLSEEIGNAAALVRLALGNNKLVGTIPKEVGNLTTLSVLDLNSNILEGTIPTELGMCTALTTLDLGNNRLSGPIPENLADLAQLQCLVLSHNNLSGSIPSKSPLYFRQVDIPFLSFLQHRGLFDLSYNGLSGSIPDELGNCVIVLSGSVPESFGNMKGLTHLDLSSNELTGELPSSLSRMLNLVGLYVQQNMFSGQVDQLLSNSIVWRIETMNFSNNLFDGELPQSLGSLSYLTYLDLHANMFGGDIPAELGNLMQLQYFDVSRNRLSGQIPEKVCGLVNLFFLNLADNMLEGPIPTSGICQKLSKDSLARNKNLCGRIMGFDCQIKSSGKSASLNFRTLAGIVLGIIVIVLLMAFALAGRVRRNKRQTDTEEAADSKLNSFLDHNLYFLGSSRSKEPLSINLAVFEQRLLKLTLVDILEATNNFCKTNIIGDGGFGTVYKATLPDGKIVAVKKLSEAKTQGEREFIAEMETLGKVKHQNLVPLLGYCSIGEEKLLVYEYMVNGSLDLWLRNRTGALEVLNWDKRFKIASGAACGLDFLHHDLVPHIIHRDIKASNILLNEDFEPKVADFGLARLISACETHVTTEVAGTFGYIPPEYGQSGKSTTRGDVYSFGVILLELVTGKEPTGPDFKEIEGGNLVGWVLQKFQKGQSADVLDPVILNADSEKMMLQVLWIARECLSEEPAKRPTMRQVWKFLKGIKDDQ